MGCGESKHAVATENTLTKSKSSTKNLEKANTPPLHKPSNDDANLINNKDEKTEEVNENSTKKEIEKEEEVADQGDQEAKTEKVPDEAVLVVEEKIIEGYGKNDEELKVEEKEEKALEVVISNESPKKGDDHHHEEEEEEEETIESLISEGISGKSDYYSPHAKGHVYEEHHDEGNSDEAISYNEKEEVIKVDEVKESSSPAGEAKLSEEVTISAAGNVEKEEDTTPAPAPASSPTDQAPAPEPAPVSSPTDQAPAPALEPAPASSPTDQVKAN